MDQNVVAFLKVLDPEDTTTGGGTASAVAGAMAGALVAMVAYLSTGKDGMEPDSFYDQLAAEARTLSNELLNGGHEDSLAFAAVRSAYRQPKQTEEERAARKEAIRAAWLYAARVPLANAERSIRVLELGRELRGRSNPDAGSDLECALLLARAGVLGCLENVEINLPNVADEEAAVVLAERARALRELAALHEIPGGANEESPVE